MKFKLTPDMNDGKKVAPPLEVEVGEIDELLDYIVDELLNDYGQIFGPGFTLTIERIE